MTLARIMTARLSWTRLIGAMMLMAGVLTAVPFDCSADVLRVGRPSARGFAGVPLATGVKHGFLRQEGLELELAVFGGGRHIGAVGYRDGVPRQGRSRQGRRGALRVAERTGPGGAANKPATVAVQIEPQDIEADIANRAYAEVVTKFSLDGKFNPKALAALSRSFVELAYLPKEPEMKTLYTEEFLPKP